MSRASFYRHVLQQFFTYGSKLKVHVDVESMSEEEKRFTESTQSTDSGFISSGNFISTEFTSEDIHQSSNEDRHSNFDSGIIQDESCNKKSSDLMRLDSGYDTCLSNFSKLSLTPGLNDLNKGKCQQQGQEVRDQERPPWEIYYEQDEDGDTHLHVAILQGFPEVVLALIRAAPHPRLLDTPNDDGQSPLHLAVATGQWRVARWLIVAGALPSPRNRTGDSPLHVAARVGDVLCCRSITDPVQQQERDVLLLSYPPTPYHHCDFDQWNYEGHTCVHVAAINGHIDVLRHLVWYGADINARDGRSGYTALHYAIERNDEKLINFLLNECRKIEVETLTYGGKSALQLGIPVGETLLEMLLLRGTPSPYSSEDEDELEESDDEMIAYDTPKNTYKPNLIINASA